MRRGTLSQPPALLPSLVLFPMEAPPPSSLPPSQSDATGSPRGGRRGQGSPRAGRGGRGRGRGGRGASPGPSSPQDPYAPLEHVASSPTATPPRRGGGGGRGRKRVGEPEPSSPALSPSAPSIAVSPAPESPSSPPRSGGRGNRGRSFAQRVGSQPMEQQPHPRGPRSSPHGHQGQGQGQAQGASSPSPAGSPYASPSRADQEGSWRNRDTPDRRYLKFSAFTNHVDPPSSFFR